MGVIKIALVFLCAYLVVSCDGAWKRNSRRSKRNHKSCRSGFLIRYQMTVKTYWDRDTFPKMYPVYRPPAHWSQLIGRSHGDKYRMWQEGTNASLAAQKFAEDEDSDYFDLELSQGYIDVMDAFVAPDIQQGVGETSSIFSVDAGHSKVSFMMKIVPSPDWFIGLDSVDLCYRGRWKKRLQRDLRPFDSGTEQGRTFTAPEWPNYPQEPISAIRSTSPDHQAGSFYYPEYKILPRLAHVEFEIVSEYKLRRVFKEIKDPERNRSVNVTNPTEPNLIDTLSKHQPSVFFPDNGEKVLQQVLSSQQTSGTASTKQDLRNAPGNVNAPENSKGTKSMSLEDYKNSVDCQVSDWSSWGSCSQTCGFGNKYRSREAIVLPKNGGANCPLLKEESLCGSMRNCEWRHFSMVNRKRKYPFRTRRRRIRRRKHLA